MAPQGTSSPRRFCNWYVRDTLCTFWDVNLYVRCCFNCLVLLCICTRKCSTDIELFLSCNFTSNIIVFRLNLAAVQLAEGSFIPLASELPSSFPIRSHDCEEIDRKRSCRRTASNSPSTGHRSHYRESYRCYRFDY